MRNFVHYILGLFADNKSVGLVLLLPLTVIVLAILSLLLRKWFTPGIQLGTFEFIMIECIFFIIGFMGVIFIIRREAPVFLVYPTGTLAVVIGMFLVAVSLWVMLKALMTMLSKLAPLY